ncbi:MAG TPA: hypothetical protein VGM78_06890, partial [Ilumatobacteraceae bacterium]
GDMTPSDVFRKHVRGCCIAEQEGYATDTIRQLGPDYVVLETDFPHADSTYPTSHRLIDAAIEPFTAEQRYAIRRGNAETWYHFNAVHPLAPASH